MSHREERTLGQKEGNVIALRILSNSSSSIFSSGFCPGTTMSACFVSIRAFSAFKNDIPRMASLFFKGATRKLWGFDDSHDFEGIPTLEMTFALTIMPLGDIVGGDEQSGLGQCGGAVC